MWDRPGWRYLLPDLLADLNTGHNIIATVFVQARSMYRDSGPLEMRPVGEVEFVNGVAAMSASGLYGKTRVAAGIAGHADLTLGSRVELVLAALARAGGGRFKGIRHITAWDADNSLLNPAYPAPKGLLGDRTFREGFAVLGRLGLFLRCVDVPSADRRPRKPRGRVPPREDCAEPRRRPHRQRRLPGKRDEVFTRWATSITSLSAHPNVYIQIGGLGQAINGLGLNERPEPPSSEALATKWRPYVEACIQAFGTSRSMFGSNFPVDKASYSYPVFWNACKILTKGASQAERRTSSRGPRRGSIG